MKFGVFSSAATTAATSPIWFECSVPGTLSAMLCSLSSPYSAAAGRVFLLAVKAGPVRVYGDAPLRGVASWRVRLLFCTGLQRF